MIGYVLAGGEAARMGGRPKGLLSLAGRPMLAWVLERFAPQVDRVVVNSNSPPQEFSAFRIEMIPDRLVPGKGPLAGLHACLCHVRQVAPRARWIATVPWDCPFLPSDLVTRLQDNAAGMDAVVAATGGRIHPLAALWHTDMADAIQTTLGEEGSHSVKGLLERLRVATVAFDDRAGEPFFNVNTDRDLEEAERLARTMESKALEETDGTASLDRTGDL